MRGKKIIVASVLVGVPAVLGGAVAVMTTSGRMVVDQQAVDVFHAHVDEQVLGYYDTVCSEITKTQGVSRDFTITAQDVVGLAPSDAAVMWKERLGEAADDLVEITRRLQQVDADAPVKVLRPDDGVEGTDFRGALVPLVQVVGDGAARVRGVVGDDRWAGVEDPVVHQEVVSEAMGVVAGIPGEVVGVLDQVVGGARVFSEATKQAVEQRSSCGSLLSPRVDQDVVFAEVVEAYGLVRRVHERFGEAMEQVEGLESLTGEDLVAARHQIAQTWSAVAETAEENRWELDQWENTREPDTPEWKAVQQVQVVAEEVARVYRDVGVWAREQESTAAQTELSVAGLQDMLNASVEGLRDQQIAEARVVTKALTTMPVPNEATRIALEEKRADGESAD